LSHKWSQAKHGKSKEFWLRSQEVADWCDLNIDSVHKYSKEFRDAGFYDLRKEHRADLGMTNVLTYMPKISFPKTEDFWNVPNVLIRPTAMDGFGLSHGMVMFLILNKCLLSKSGIFKISVSNIAKSLGFIRQKTATILTALNESEMVKIEGNMCSVDLEYVCSYFENLNNMWDLTHSEVAQKAQKSRILNNRKKTLQVA